MALLPYENTYDTFEVRHAPSSRRCSKLTILDSQLPNYRIQGFGLIRITFLQGAVVCHAVRHPGLIPLVLLEISS